MEMTPEPGQQTCKVCGRPDKFDFKADDSLWGEIVPAEFQSRVVCLFCFDEFANARSLDYAGGIETLYFAGKRATFEFSVTRRV